MSQPIPTIRHFTRQPRKQRLQRLESPGHVARKQVASHLSEELLLKYNRRSLSLRKGDEVKVMRGDHKGKTGRVITVDVPARKVVVDGVTVKKTDGTEKPLPISPSALLIVKLNLEDNRRREKLAETEEASKMGKAGTPKARPGGKAQAPKKAAAKSEHKSDSKAEAKVTA